jgi:hypothetical protein
MASFGRPAPSGFGSFRGLTPEAVGFVSGAGAAAVGFVSGTDGAGCWLRSGRQRARSVARGAGVVGRGRVGKRWRHLPGGRWALGVACGGAAYPPHPDPRGSIRFGGRYGGRRVRFGGRPPRGRVRSGTETTGRWLRSGRKRARTPARGAGVVRRDFKEPGSGRYRRRFHYRREVAPRFARRGVAW